MKSPNLGKKHRETDPWVGGLGAWVQKKDTAFSGFHELINLPDITFPFNSLRCIPGQLEVSLTLALALLIPCESQDMMDEVVFWANSCDVCEQTGRQKSRIWKLFSQAFITALSLRLVVCWVGHINNKPTAEPLWLPDDVLHSHHPSQRGDLWTCGLVNKN